MISLQSEGLSRVFSNTTVQKHQFLGIVRIFSALLGTEEMGDIWEAPIIKSRTRLSDFTFTFHFHVLEKEMATYSSVLAWRIPGMGEPGGLPSVGSHRVGHD